MDEDDKKLLNECIATLRTFCKEQDNCNDCPFRKMNCDGYSWSIPYNWEELR